MNTAVRVGAVLLAAAIVVLLSTRGENLLLVAGLVVGLVALVAREVFLRRAPDEEELSEEELLEEELLEDGEFPDDAYLDDEGWTDEPDLGHTDWPEGSRSDELFEDLPPDAERAGAVEDDLVEEPPAGTDVFGDAAPLAGSPRLRHGPPPAGGEQAPGQPR